MSAGICGLYSTSGRLEMVTEAMALGSCIYATSPPALPTSSTRLVRYTNSKRFLCSDLQHHGNSMHIVSKCEARISHGSTSAMVFGGMALGCWLPHRRGYLQKIRLPPSHEQPKHETSGDSSAQKYLPLLPVCFGNVCITQGYHRGCLLAGIFYFQLGF